MFSRWRTGVRRLPSSMILPERGSKAPRTNVREACPSRQAFHPNDETAMVIALVALRVARSKPGHPSDETPALKEGPPVCLLIGYCPI